MQSGYALRDIAPPRVRAFVPDTSDEALIGLIADGDKRAMQVLYGRHNVRVYRFIVRLTGNASLAARSSLVRLRPLRSRRSIIFRLRLSWKN